MNIPFTKTHGDHNDFLITPEDSIPPGVDRAAIARRICDRYAGVGADGWLVISPSPDADAAIELWNSDGSRSEMSGNGTRCAAAYLIEKSKTLEKNNTGESIQILTGAGLKALKLLTRAGRQFSLEMNMGRPVIEDLHARCGNLDCTILNVGNPQCAVFVTDFDFNWRSVGASIESDPRFPNRTNVSFIRRLDRHRLDVRFFERGAGETMSSGTGSTGAGAAAVARGLVESPVEIQTPAGSLLLRWENGEILLAGPAEIVATGDYYL